MIFIDNKAELQKIQSVIESKQVEKAMKKLKEYCEKHFKKLTEQIIRLGSKD